MGEELLGVRAVGFEAGDVTGGYPDPAGDGAGVVHLDEDEGCGPSGRCRGDGLDAVVGPP